MTEPRGQMLVWDMGPKDPADRPWGHVPGIHETLSGPDTRHVFCAVGILETWAGVYEEDMIRGFAAFRSEASVSLRINEYSQAIPVEFDQSDIGECVTAQVWPAPPAAFGTWPAGGGVSLRRTRMPARDGMEVMTFVMMMKLAPGTLANNHMYSLTGSVGRWPNDRDPPWQDHAGGFEISDPVDLSETVQRGINLGQLLREPLWGWGDEKVAFRSTMPLRVLDVCQEVEDLRAIESRTPEQQVRLDELRKGPLGWITANRDKDPMFDRFVVEMDKRRPPERWDAVVTKSQVEESGRLAQQVIADVLLAA